MNNPSLSILTRDCLSLTKNFAAGLKRSDAKIPKGLDVKVSDQACRLAVWAGNIGAHKTGSSSLDFRLRDTPRIKDAVVGLLCDLKRILENGLAVLGGEVTPWDELPEDEEEEDMSGDEGEPKTELEQTSMHVKDLVDYLLSASDAIRSPAPHARSLASSTAAADMAHYEKYDVEHVRSKFPGVDGWLAERLGKANTRRREYLEYRKAHRRRPARGLAGEEETGGAPDTEASSLPDTCEGPGADAFCAGDSEADEDRLSWTSYAATETGSGQMGLPPRPLEADKGPFECPFCFMIVTTSDTRSWKKHVFGDLRPYVCLEETCSRSDQDFERRREWLFHMREAHWRTYHCPSGCGEWFVSRAKCRQHVEATHAMQITPGRLDAQIKLHSEDIDDEASLACPLCGEEQRSVKLYRRHVGRHQEQLSLFALPSLESAEGDAEPSSSSSKSSRRSDTGQVHDLPGKDEDKNEPVATPPRTEGTLLNTHDAALDSAQPMTCGFCTDETCRPYTAPGLRAHVEEEHAELYKLAFARCYLGKETHSPSSSAECGVCKGLFYNPECPGGNSGFCITSDPKGRESTS